MWATSRKFSLIILDAKLGKFLTLPSEVIVDCNSMVCALWGRSGSRNGIDAPHRSTSFPTASIKQAPLVIPVLPQPALTPVGIGLRLGRPSARLTYILSNVHSVPALASITFVSVGV